MATKLSAEESARRKKARANASFSDSAYRHYDVRAGYGSLEEWLRIAEVLASGCGTLKSPTVVKSGLAADLEWFGLESLPGDVGCMKRAFKNACFVYHPDHGGSTEDFTAMYAAYGRVLKHY
jgi:hypothetical protein